MSATAPALFRQPDFLRLWLVGFVVFVVRWLETLAVSVFIYQTTGSAFLVAAITMLRMLPMVLLGAVIGAVAERLDRRVTLIAVVVQMMATSAALALLSWAGALALWHLALASLLNGLGWATDNPVRRAMMGEAAGAHRMGRAMSADVASNNSSRMLGPTLGGALLALLDIGGAFSLCTALYLIALWAAITVSRLAPATAPPAGGILARMAQGFALVRRDPRLVGAMLVTILYNVFGWPFSAMIVVIGKDSLALGPIGLGLLSSMEGIGALAGAIGTAAFARPGQYARIYVGGVIAYMLAAIAFALSTSIPLSAVALFLTGIGGAWFAVMQTTLVYQATPAEARARVLGILSVCIGSAVFGFLGLGLAAGRYGAVTASAFWALAGLVSLALTWPWWRAVLSPRPG
jgi:MFS family permease